MGCDLFQVSLMHFRQIMTKEPRTKPTQGLEGGKI